MKYDFLLKEQPPTLSTQFGKGLFYPFDKHQLEKIAF